MALHKEVIKTMIFELNDIVRIKGGNYCGSNARVIGRQNPCTEESEMYLVEIVPTKGVYNYTSYGVWVEVRTKHMELLKANEK